MESGLGLFSLCRECKVMIGLLNCELGCIADGLVNRMKRGDVIVNWVHSLLI